MGQAATTENGPVRWRNAIRSRSLRATSGSYAHMDRPWIDLHCPESGDISPPAVDDFERCARFLFQQPATQELADYLEEHGAAFVRHGFDDGPMHVLEVTCGGRATLESWADQDYMTELMAPVSMTVGEAQAVELWSLLASGDIDAVRAAFPSGS